jgi:hypothetical protein
VADRKQGRKGEVNGTEDITAIGSRRIDVKYGKRSGVQIKAPAEFVSSQYHGMCLPVFHQKWKSIVESNLSTQGDRWYDIRKLTRKRRRLPRFSSSITRSEKNSFRYPYPRKESVPLAKPHHRKPSLEKREEHVCKLVAAFWESLTRLTSEAILSRGFSPLPLSLASFVGTLNEKDALAKLAPPHHPVHTIPRPLPKGACGIEVGRQGGGTESVEGVDCCIH